MGFSGVGLRSVGSRHLRDGAVVNRVIGSDAVTTTKIAPETILEVDISPSAVGSREIAANAISYLDQIKDNIIGSSKLDSDSIYSVKIQADTIGHSKLTTGLQGSLGGNLGLDIIGTTQIKKPGVDSENIMDDAIGSPNIMNDAISYAEQIKDYIIPTARTGDLWRDNKLRLNIQHGRIGSITHEFQITKSIPQPLSYENHGITFATDKKRLWTYVTVVYVGPEEHYIYEIGTTSGSIKKHITVDDTGYLREGIAFAPDTGNLWLVENVTSSTPHIWEIGTTSGNIKKDLAYGLRVPVGSKFYGLTFAPDNNRLWTVAGQPANPMYIFEIGTISGDIIGSFQSPYVEINNDNIAFDNLRKKLWSYFGGNIYLLGTIDGTISDVTSFPYSYGVVHVQEKDRIWRNYRNNSTITEWGRNLGTYIKFNPAFGPIKPHMGVVGLSQSEIFIRMAQPYFPPDWTGSVLVKAGSYPAGPVTWIAVGPQ